MSGSLKRSSSSRASKKMTLAMLKGKSSNISVPSIRFNPGEEDVELEQNDWDQNVDDNDEKILTGSEGLTEPSVELKPTVSKHSPLFSSISADAPKEKLHLLDNSIKSNKRSTSLDSGSIAMETSESRSLFRELKGKITKTMEETLRIDLRAAADSKFDEVSDSAFEQTDCVNSPEVAEEAFELLDGDGAESMCVSSQPVRGRSDILRQLTTEIKNKRSRLGHRTNQISQPSFTMSTLVAQTEDDEEIEKRLGSEYDKEAVSSSQEEFFLELAPSSPSRDSKQDSKDSRSSRSFLASQHKVTLLLIAIAVLCAVSFPPFLLGLTTGISLTLVAVVIHERYIAPKPRVQLGASTPDSTVHLTHLQIPIVRVKPPQVHKGWLNELRQTYDPSNYHVSQTSPVFVRLEGSLLRISHPRAKIPRHASWNETSHETIFYHQRYYHLAQSQIVLLPVGLTRKRLWSRKYPLCIILSDSACRTGHLCVSPTDDEIGNEQTSPLTTTSTSEECIYLFARTCRDKEEWYWLFKEAIANKSKAQAQANDTCQELISHMSKWIPCKEGNNSPVEQATSTNDTVWLNALLSRVFWDFLREPQWAEYLVARIQRKLSKIKVPYFMEELRLSALELGSQLPTIEYIAPPTMDARGLWIDFNLSYQGSSCVMTLETKLNLMKLKKGNDLISSFEKVSSRTAAFDSDEEDSAESSTDEDVDSSGALNDVPYDQAVSLSRLAASQGGGATSKKILRFVDKITQSRYFQHATEYKYVRKAMQGVSNTRLILRVELQALAGTVALNIPPPPTDRLWYGFRTNPKIVLVARPRLGERAVMVASVTEWIENKLVQEFQKILVMPNMDDLVIPIMTSGINYANPSQEENTKM